MTEKELEMLAVSLVERLLKVVDEQKQTIVKYEGAIEGIKLFMQELKKTLEERNGNVKPESSETKAN